MHDEIQELLEKGDRQGMFAAITEGLRQQYDSFELYYMLGFYYLPVNRDQAYICFYQSLLYAKNENEIQLVADTIEELESSGGITVKKTAVVVAVYNACYFQQKNIESIRKTLPEGTYSIIAVDNASTDGVTEYLEQQEDVILIKNTENLGFAPACNQAARYLESIGDDSDIFLLNNDTRLTPNALFYLKLGLYENEKTGATGAVSNYAGNEQQIELLCENVQQYIEFGKQNNIPMERPYDERVRLSGFAMLIRHEAWLAAGGMDEAFAPGYFEDDDLCMKITAAGYKMAVCKNSFIYHAGSQSFSQLSGVNELLNAHQKLFIEKYGFNVLLYAKPRYSLISQIPYGRDDAFSILIAESALGADAKYIRTLYPKADVVCIETREEFKIISKHAEPSFDSASELSHFIRKPIFNVLLFDKNDLMLWSDQERLALSGMCRHDCVVINQAQHAVDFGKVKLIVWDMDDTFWKGTISEEEVEVSAVMEQLIVDLSERGIINSISSKNDEEPVKTKLSEFGLWQLFVFNNINWLPKGAQLADKIKAMSLRAENVLFIDDNPRNLQEAAACCDGLMTAGPDIIPAISEYVNRMPVSDRELQRLQQYILLEKKQSVKSEYDTPERFLYDSDIKAFIGDDCLENADRIADLVMRSNQLNYTKKREDKETLIKLFADNAYECRYIKVRDKYGDYGIAGFYCIHKESRALYHYLFSCRSMGMDLQQAVYELLGAPSIEIAEPVAMQLVKGKSADWVQFVSDEEWQLLEQKVSENSNGSSVRVLLKGPCDMDSLVNYLTSPDPVCEFNYINSRGFVTTGQNHSMHLYESQALSVDEIQDILSEAPFLIYGDFDSTLFTKEYDVICYSLLPDSHAGLYKNKRTGHFITFGSRCFDLTDPEMTSKYIEGSVQNHGFAFTKEIISDFAEKWEYVGATSIEQLLHNLQFIYDNVKGAPEIILLLGSEIPFEGVSEEFAEHEVYHREVNEAVRRFAAEYDRVKLIEITDYIESQEDYVDCINHFSRRVYQAVAQRIDNYCIDAQQQVR